MPVVNPSIGENGKIVNTLRMISPADFHSFSTLPFFKDVEAV